MDIEDHAIVICAKIGRHDIHRMYVDGGSASKILYQHCFVRLRPKVRCNLVPTTVSLIGFSREIFWPLGQILLRPRSVRWKPTDLTGVPKMLTEQKLGVKKGTPEPDKRNEVKPREKQGSEGRSSKISGRDVPRSHQNKDRIQASSKKAKVVINMPSPRTLKDAQSLNAERTLNDMKKQMAELPTLTAHIQRETLIMYLSMAKEAISAVLLTERGDKQIPMSFVGRALQPPEIN
nr:reverse transcriptase domain-containing protein [Tanacetum cinerariifolium]